MSAENTAPSAPKINPDVTTRLLDGLLGKIRQWLSQSFFDLSSKWLVLLGQWALVVAAVAGFLCGIICAIKANSFNAFLYGLGWVLIVVVLQFVASKLLPAGEGLIGASPSRMASRAFLDCIALRPEMLNVAITPGARAGEEAIGLITFFIKALMKMVPILSVPGLLERLLQGGRRPDGDAGHKA